MQSPPSLLPAIDFFLDDLSQLRCALAWPERLHQADLPDLVGQGMNDERAMFGELEQELSAAFCDLFPFFGPCLDHDGLISIWSRPSRFDCEVPLFLSLAVSIIPTHWADDDLQVGRPFDNIDGELLDIGPRFEDWCRLCFFGWRDRFHTAIEIDNKDGTVNSVGHLGEKFASRHVVSIAELAPLAARTAELRYIRLPFELLIERSLADDPATECHGVPAGHFCHTAAMFTLATNVFSCS